MEMLKIAVVLILSCVSFSSSLIVCPNHCSCYSSGIITSVTCVSVESFVKVPKFIPAQTTTMSIEFTNINALTDQDLLGLFRLQELLLSSNRLANISSGALKDLHHLKILDLSNNLLTTLPPNLFRSIFNLSSLVLQGNRLNKVNPSWFYQLQGLKWLDLSKNMLVSLYNDLFHNLTSLEILDLSSNKLEYIPATLFDNMPKLDRLSLGENEFTTFSPGTFDNVNKLKYLFLNNNKIVKIPEMLFHRLPILDMLDLSQNKLTSLPIGLFDNLLQIGAGWHQGMDLSHNPWDCNCDIIYLWNWLNVNFEKVYFLSTTVCAKPDTFSGKEITTFSLAELMC
ncbi:uncharacterized protein LOC144599135 isoform X2 [Rhinoraja longicauda]